MLATPIQWFRLIAGALLAGLAAFAVYRALPPRTVVIETGPVDGSYYDAAERYRDLLAKRGIDLVLRPQPDSLRIIDDVDRHSGGADIGFTAQAIPRDRYLNTAAAGAIELQPLFIFYNVGMGEVGSPVNLRGLRLVMPPEHSATSEATLRLLRLYDITPNNTRISFLPLADAVRGLVADEFDAGFFMLAPSNRFITELFNADSLRPLSLNEAQGITRHLPFLRAATLARGSYNVENNVPPIDVKLLASTVDVIVHKDINPGVLYALLDAMNRVHHGSTLISDTAEFPSIVTTDLLPHPLAVSYAKSGTPWIYRELPLWLASLIDSYLIIGILIFVVTEIYKSLKYLSELCNVIVETLCLRALLRIERATQPGTPVTGVHHLLMRVAESALARESKRKRGQQLLDRIRRYAEPGP